MWKRTHRLAATMIVAGTLLGVLPASAATWSYPASQCVNSGTVETKDSWLRYWTDSLVTTFGPTDLNISCPAVQQGGTTLATVTGRKWYSTDSVSCKLVVRDAAGGNLHMTAPVTITAPGPFTLDLTMGTPWPYSYPGGTKVIVCKIPKAPFDNSAEIYSYTITESA